MSPTTRRIMSRFRRKMRRGIGMEISACGHEEPLHEAFDVQFAAEAELEAEIEALVDKIDKLESPIPGNY